VRFRAWESSAMFVTVIALFFGGFFPVPSSFYPVWDHWRWRDARDADARLGQLGRATLASEAGI
jgi:hypothetical protein